MTAWARRLYAVLPMPWLEPWLDGGGCAVVHDAPLILLLPEWVLWSINGALLPVFHRYRRTPVHLLVNFSWYREEEWHIREIAARHARHLRAHPDHRLLYLANTETQQRALAQAGLDALFMNQNALVDPEIFHPVPTVAKRFDAVYDARICPFKRHHLARDVGSLALLAAVNPHYHDEAYVREVRHALPVAHWYNDPLSPDYRSLYPAEVNLRLNECRVGLCLSAEEGAMFASIQYLLAGLPVVSTRSRGGRDVFFDPDYVLIVDDDPRAVAEGVRSLSECPVPPAEIRRRTLERMAARRRPLLAALAGIVGEQAENVLAEWRSWKAGGNPEPATPADIFARIRQCTQRRQSPGDDAAALASVSVQDALTG